jgi:outer membrane protein OmpA-like peptidoglycan-associated protein/uncharacterized surface protein with fasciclin (FAS1) repeats
MASPRRRDARRYRRRILVIGAAAFGVLYVVMAPMYVDGVEADLEARVPDELAEAGFEGIVATFDGQDGTLSCDQPLPDPEAARQAAYDIWGVRSIELDRSCRVNTDPEFTADSSTSSLPDDELADARADMTASSVTTVSVATTTPETDEPVETSAVPTTSQPEPPAFESVAAAVSGTPQLSLLAVLLHEAGLDAELADPLADPITLFAASDDALESLSADVLGRLRADPDALRALLIHHCAPGALTADQLTGGDLAMCDESVQPIGTDPLTIDGIEVSASDIDAPNGVVHIIDGVIVPDGVAVGETPTASVTVQSDGGSIAITGVASTEAVREALAEAAAAPGVEVADAMTIDPQAGLDAATAGELQVLVQVLREHLVNGSAGFDGESLYLNGTYLTESDRDAAVAAVAGFGIEPTLTPPPAATVDDAVDLEADMNEYVRENPILFEQNRADITDESVAVVDQIARLAQQFDAVVITVNGHTDSDGNPNDNLWLSRIRARAVHDALVARGLDDAVVSWEGFGSEQPIIVDGVEDKAASRRVEFDVEVLS